MTELDKIIGELDVYIRDTYGVSPQMTLKTKYYKSLKIIGEEIIKRKKKLNNNDNLDH